MSTVPLTKNKQPSTKSIQQLLNDPKVKEQIALALPRHLNSDRMARIVLTEMRRMPKLQSCEPFSLLGAIIQCSQLGLEPGNNLGHAYLLPYGKECQLIIGYRGMIDLAYRSGKVRSVSAHEVYANDHFEFYYGSQQIVRHIPARADRGALIGFYAIAHLKDGGEQFEVMWKEEVDKIRNFSKAAQSGPWVTHYEEMGKKTVCRRLFKYLPVSIEIQQAITLDESAERGEQLNRFLIETEANHDIDNEDNSEHLVAFTKADRMAEQLSTA